MCLGVSVGLCTCVYVCLCVSVCPCLCVRQSVVERRVRTTDTRCFIHSIVLSKVNNIQIDTHIQNKIIMSTQNKL